MYGFNQLSRTLAGSCGLPFEPSRSAREVIKLRLYLVKCRQDKIYFTITEYNKIIYREKYINLFEIINTKPVLKLPVYTYRVPIYNISNITLQYVAI